MTEQRKPLPEDELDVYIDSLNAEASPAAPSSPGAADSAWVARAVRRLRTDEAAEPAADFPDTLKRHALASHARVSPFRRPLPRLAMIAAALAIAIAVAMLPAIRGTDIGAAMADAVGKLTSYHGTIEVLMVSVTGEQQPVRTSEVWVDGDKYAVKQSDGTLTVNDGTHKWQLRPADQVVAQLPAVPDPERLAFDLRAEGERANGYPHRVVGREQVAGRWATILAVTPPGGNTYRLWVDEETHMPVRLETTAQYSPQTIVTYTSLEINVPVAPISWAYSLPAGYRIVSEDPGQEVQTVAAAAALCGFEPLIPAQFPARLIAHQASLVLDYGDTVITEQKASGEFVLQAGAAFGSAAGGQLEVTADGIRWRQGGLEISISGPARETLGRMIAADLTMPVPANGFPQSPAVTLPVDLAAAANAQKSVDAGHSPWMLEADQTAMAFLNGRLGPDTIPYDALKVELNDGVHAIISVSRGQCARIYVQRLVRQDPSGIWSVVGYDLR